MLLLENVFSILCNVLPYNSSARFWICYWCKCREILREKMILRVDKWVKEDENTKNKSVNATSPFRYREYP